jgi:hypothetical protein
MVRKMSCSSVILPEREIMTMKPKGQPEMLEEGAQHLREAATGLQGEKGVLGTEPSLKTCSALDISTLPIHTFNFSKENLHY